MAEPPRRPVGSGIWPAELKLIENPEVRAAFVTGLLYQT